MQEPSDRNKVKEIEKEKLDKQVKKYVKKGGTISVYPEGAITDEGQMNYKFRRGMKKKTNNEKS